MKRPFFLVLIFVSAVSAAAFSRKAAPPADAGAKSAADSVWVSKADGGKQCADGSGEPLEKGAQVLIQARVHVLDQRKGSDGKLHAQMCGAESGTENAYRIPKTDLPQAVAVGFKAVQSQP